jgi:hypothetical protein
MFPRPEQTIRGLGSKPAAIRTGSRAKIERVDMLRMQIDA